jgi:uncharacterized protein (DUF3084 family)
MTTGYILIVAMLILGGVIATIGDRIGTRVGKARLSLFNLRPRKTAVLVTIITGALISASTLAVLFAASDQLRTGVFELRRIQNNLTRARKELEQARTQKNRVESELEKARSEQTTAQNRLDKINQFLKAAIARQARTETQLQRTEGEKTRAEARLSRTQNQLNRIEASFQQAQAQLRTVSQQEKGLRAGIRQLQAERQELIRQRDLVKAQIAQRDQEIAARDRAIAQRDQEIASREQVIAQSEIRLQELENQRAYLAQEVEKLEREAQGLRQGNVAILRDQVLASGVVRIVNPAAAEQAVNQLLSRANRKALEALQPGTTNFNEGVVQITETEVEQLINQIDDGQDYLVRILSASNYVVGEKQIRVFADVARNQVIFLAGDVLAATSIDPSTLNDREIQERINFLVAASRFRARRAGVLTDTIQLGDIQTLIRFIGQIKQYKQPIDVRAVVAEVAYTAGPLKVELVAVQNGNVIFRTGSFTTQENPAPPQ